MISDATERPVIEWTRPKLTRFKAALKRAGDNECFIFEGHEFVVAYARYLVTYLEEKLGKEGQ